jgi:arylformamidase
MIPPHTAEELSRLYNNSLAVTDYADYLERWQARSRAMRERVSHHAGLVYGDRPRERIDLFMPDTSSSTRPPWPLFIFLHGGYWQFLDKHDWSCVAEPFIASGMAVAIVGYTLCPEISVAGIVDEIATACEFLHLQADQYSLDSGRFHVGGHSAGGHLATMMLATDWPARDARLPVQLFRSAIAISGVFDLEPLTLTPLNDALRLTRDDALAVSPIFRRNIARTPLLVVVGGAETAEFLRQSRALCTAWPENGYLEAPALNHFSVIDAFHYPAAALFQSAWQHMNGGSAAS